MADQGSKAQLPGNQHHLTQFLLPRRNFIRAEYDALCPFCREEAIPERKIKSWEEQSRLSPQSYPNTLARLICLLRYQVLLLFNGMESFSFPVNISTDQEICATFWIHTHINLTTTVLLA